MREAGGPALDALRLEPVAEAEGGRLSRAGRLWVLETHGAARSRGRQHGHLLREQVRAGVVPVLARRAFDLPEIRQADPAVKAALETFVTHLYTEVESSISEAQREELIGLSETSGLAYDDLFRASFLSEILQTLAAAGAAQHHAVAHGACTAAVVVGERAVTGGSIHGKNQDYDGGGLWDRYPLVHIAHPEEGLAHICATTAGLIKSNIALNAAGVSVGGHFLFSSKAGSSGRSYTMLERELVLHARSVAEALDILGSAPCVGSFALVVSDRSGAAAVAECDGRGVRVRRAQNGWLGMSNLFSAGGDETDLLRRSAGHRNPLSRQTRVNQCGSEISTPADVRHLAAILADRFDPASGRRRGPAHVIAHATTVTSAIAQTAPLRFWVGEAVCPASHGRFIGFDCAEGFKAPGAISLCGSFENGLSQDATCIAGFRSFLRARAAFNGGDELAACAALIEAETIDPEEGAYPRFLARLLMRAGAYEGAEDCITRARLSVQGRNELGECALIGGFIADLRGDRQAALQRYRDVEELAQEESAGAFGWINPKLRRAAQSCIERPFDADQARSLDVPFDLISGIE